MQQKNSQMITMQLTYLSERQLFLHILRPLLFWAYPKSFGCRAALEKLGRPGGCNEEQEEEEHGEEGVEGDHKLFRVMSIFFLAGGQEILFGVDT